MQPLAEQVLRWQAEHGRHDLPWQQPADPYRTWISEIMLQQTRVETVIPYFQRFIQRFPDLQALAEASQDEVLALWSGLGYYSRARNLHKAAQQAWQDQQQLPDTLEALNALPGIGRSTAGAILSLGFGQPAPILDGNVKRLFCRHFAIEGWPGKSAIQKQLWALAEAQLPAHDCGRYNQGLMDLGAGICTRSRPACDRCPLRASCQAYRQDQVAALPTPRPRKALPSRHCTLWWLRQGDAILLHRRPEAGIWGGLWSLPQQDEQHDLPSWLDAALSGPVGEPLRLKHTFTHFHLHIRVRESTLSDLPPRLEPAWRWQPLDELDQLGLPAPVRRIAQAMRTPT